MPFHGDEPVMVPSADVMSRSCEFDRPNVNNLFERIDSPAAARSDCEKVRAFVLPDVVRTRSRSVSALRLSTDTWTVASAPAVSKEAVAKVRVRAATPMMV